MRSDKDFESEKDFEALVRKSGTVFTTNVGNGPEEMVLAIATTTLKKTQVATQADMVAAGYVRVEGLKRAEADRERVALALADSQANLVAAHKEMAARHAALSSENSALKAKIAELELVRQAEQDGVAARNADALLVANPYSLADEHKQTARQAWAHGWKLRNVLLSLNQRVRSLSEELVALDDRKQGLEQQVTALSKDKAALQAHIQAVQSERQALALRTQELEAGRNELETRYMALGQHLGRQDEAARIVREEATRVEAERQSVVERFTLQSGRLQKIQAAYQRLLMEAPHAAVCSRVTGAGMGCDCWLLKFGYAALETPRV